MKEPDTIETLQRRKFRWDKIVNGLKITLGFYAFFVLTYLAVQGVAAQQQMANVLDEVERTTNAVRESQLANQKTGTENHAKTRAYIKCLVTEVLTVPLKERTTVDLDTCTNTADKSPETDAVSNSEPTIDPPQVQMNIQPTILPTPTPMSDTPKVNEPVAVAPPDPPVTPSISAAEDRSALGKLPLIGGLLNALGL